MISTLIVGTIGGVGCALSQISGCSRLSKTIHSDWGDGLNRVVYVYSMDGGLMVENAGKFDIDYDSERIIFDDENNKRHQIYFGSGTVVIDELTEEELQEIITKRDDNSEGAKVYTYLPQNN